jgi:putative membrane protein
VEALVTERVDRGLVAIPVAGIWSRVCLAATACAVPAQIAFPLLSGAALTAVTVLTVLLLATAGVAHAATTWGPAAGVRLLLAAGGIGLVAESVGLHSGYPFGRYTYTPSLGAGILGVPLVVLLAWTMMSYPAILLARRLAASTVPARATTAVLGGITLAAWDLFLDPQLVASGFWTWQHPEPGLPGVSGVPLTNLVGWLLVGTLLTAVLDRLLPSDPTRSVSPTRFVSPVGLWLPRPADQVVPAVLLAWTWLGSTVANLAFFDRPALAGYGFPTLGATVAPYLLLVWLDLRGSR